MTIRRRDESGAVLDDHGDLAGRAARMAALVVDLGGSYSQRRKMQSCGRRRRDRCRAETSRSRARRARPAQAATIGNENLPKLTPNWNGCAGDTLPQRSWRTRAATASRSAPTRYAFACAYRARRSRRLFGKILGYSNTGTSTVAIAGLRGVGNGGGSLPFAVGGSFGAGDYCLDSGGNGNSSPPCDGPTTGNFGVLSFAHCGVNSGLDDDIAAGADHIYTSNPTGDARPTSPTTAATPGPNTVLTEPGNNTGTETSGTAERSRPVRRRRTGTPATGAERLQCLLAGLGIRELGLRMPRGDRQSPALGVHSRVGLDPGVPISCRPRDVRHAACRDSGARYQQRSSCTPR